jgi:hypothetical protein
MVGGIAAASGLRTQVKLLLLFFSLLTLDPASFAFSPLVRFHVDADAGVGDVAAGDLNPSLAVVGAASPPLLLPNAKPFDCCFPPPKPKDFVVVFFCFDPPPNPVLEPKFFSFGLVF